ncbi:GntR family transcriptional regulator [Jannaschia sp. 2305UL9-9]|uniref:GntR family transcriptional regulator n=1 Tax=Jannaschia sp. 2305UL9-9 TaxID=3121638 RepID=UPI0035272C35
MILDVEDMKGWRLDPLKAVAPQLRLILRSRIIRNDFKPMSRLSEPDLAKEYKVSRQPVREAFITLEHEDLVEIRPQRGTYVKRIDANAVLNGQFVREAVEADIICSLARDRDRDLVRDLRAQLEDQAATSRDNPAVFMEQDEKFHRTLARAAGVEGAWTYLEAIKAQMDRVRFFSGVEFPIETLIDQHRHIIDMIEAGNVEAAEAAMRSHLKEILKSLPKIQQLYPGHFVGDLGGVDDR